MAKKPSESAAAAKEFAPSADEDVESPDLKDSLETLRRLGGRASFATEASEFQSQVMRILKSLPGAQVTEHPVSAGASLRPDALLSINDQSYLIEARAPTFLSGGQLRREIQNLRLSLDAFGAEKALLVVPDGASAPRIVSDPRVDILTFSELYSRLSSY